MGQHKDTRWYCVEENEVEEGFFYWNENQVELVVRPLFDSEKFHYTDDYAEIRFILEAYRPIIIRITQTEMIIVKQKEKTNKPTRQIAPAVFAVNGRHAWPEGPIDCSTYAGAVECSRLGKPRPASDDAGL